MQVAVRRAWHQRPIEIGGKGDCAIAAAARSGVPVAVSGPRVRYHPRMSKLLLNLRGVPDDEADDVRRFLDADSIRYYETKPTLWGTAGGIWVDDGDVGRAKRLMADYQRERQARARAERAEAERNGTAQTFLDVVRTEPLRVALAMLGAALLLALMAVPVLLLWE
jgi:hypothetical protein